MSATTDEIKRGLRGESPGWSIITTDRDRWWATRYPVHDPATRRLVEHSVTAVDADTAEKLRAKLGEIERR
ncbi:hypothetical protein SMC26_08475 [Actinomadura fulvescens]|uniref:hypothetical protein n=1 Tax=Actinomadura fulvescens TaxID=46160 RepID=UPI0031D432E6